MPLRVAPVLREASDGSVDPNLPTATVEIPEEAGLRANDLVTLTWLGTRANGAPHVLQISRVVTSGGTGKPLLLAINGAENLRGLEGGFLNLSYQIERGSLTLRSFPSELRVGQPSDVSLPAPTTAPAFTDGVIDPNVHKSDIAIVVTYPQQRTGQTVAMTWTAEVGRGTADSVAVRTGVQVRFPISHAQLLLNYGGSVTVTYTVTEPGQALRTSAPLALEIGAVSAALPEPVVPEAVNGLLDPSALIGNATFRIPPEAQLQSGDSVDFWWEAASTEASWSKHGVIADGSGRVPDQKIPIAVVRAGEGTTVRVRYVVLRALTGREVSSPYLELRIQTSRLLAAPTFEEARNGNLNTDDLREAGRATALVDGSAKVRVGDTVTVLMTPLNSDLPAKSIPFQITRVDPNRGLRLDILLEHIMPLRNLTIDLSYTLQRFSEGANPTIERSDPTTYTVSSTVGAGRLRVLGARYPAGSNRSDGAPRTLSALDKDTQQPMIAEWQYLGDTEWRTGSRWRDKQPHRALRVRSTTDALLIYPANVIGNGWVPSYLTAGGFTAMMQNSRTLQYAGTSDPLRPHNPRPLLFSVQSWGFRHDGGEPSQEALVLDNVVSVVSTIFAFTAIDHDGLATCWGRLDAGGELPAAARNLKFIEVVSNPWVFCGRVQSPLGGNNGRLYAWPSNVSKGGVIPAAVLALNDVVAVYSGGEGFAARRSNGQVVSWGRAHATPSHIEVRRDIVNILGNGSSFAAITAENSLLSWGLAGYGVPLPAEIAARRDIATLEAATQAAYCALDSIGRLVPWGGWGPWGATLPSALIGWSGFVEVTGNFSAFCARHNDGYVKAWGETASGGVVPPAIASLRDIVQVASTERAFAALRKDGSVVAWGAPAFGGDLSQIGAQLVDVQAIYANANAFTALRSDGRVVSWGNAVYGGDNSRVREIMRGRVITGIDDPLAIAAGRR